MFDHRAVHIDQVKGAVGTNAKVDRPAVTIGGGEELDLVAVARREKRRAVRVKPVVVDDVQDRIGHEDRSFEFFRKSAAAVKMMPHEHEK
jgi:hypothetical protein